MCTYDVMQLKEQPWLAWQAHSHLRNPDPDMRHRTCSLSSALEGSAARSVTGAPAMRCSNDSSSPAECRRMLYAFSTPRLAEYLLGVRVCCSTLAASLHVLQYTDDGVQPRALALQTKDHLAGLTACGRYCRLSDVHPFSAADFESHNRKSPHRQGCGTRGRHRRRRRPSPPPSPCTASWAAGTASGPALQSIMLHIATFRILLTPRLDQVVQ